MGDGGENVQLVDVGVEDAVYETDAWAFVGVLIGEFDVDFPEATGEGRWRVVRGQIMVGGWGEMGIVLSSGPLKRT